MVAKPTVAPPRNGSALALALLAGAAVAVSIGVYARVHHAASRPLFLLWFSGMLQLKSWFATAALVLVVVQVLTALWIWGHLPGAGRAPAWVPDLHRWSGSVAFTLTLPVALHCVWSLGFVTATPRVLAHGLFGCLFYGAYAAKMLGLRLAGLPARTLPVLGGVVVTCVMLLWLTAALWFFTRSGLPLT
jgi:hypothetical protein